MQKLTEKQKVVLASIRDLTRKIGKSPTMEELRCELGYAGISSVQRHLTALKKKGFISSEPHHARSLEVNLSPEDQASIPLVGNVACGLPLLAEENIEAYIVYNRSKLCGSPKDYFFLRATGDSMNRAGIDDGDYVLVKQQAVADIGQKVVALIGDEATIKKLEKKNGFYVLAPESSNPQNKPIYMRENFHIQGVIFDVIKERG